MDEAKLLQLEMWRLRKQLQKLDNTNTNSTSVVSLVMPPGEDINKMVQMLNQEATQADCIKSRQNRQAVQTAIILAANRCKLYPKMPKNGLAVFAGEVYVDGKIKKIAVHFSPCKPIGNFMYSCDGVFHTQEVKDLLTVEEVYGFIIMDGHGTLIATLCGSHREIKHRMLVDLPKKHGRGGQSSVRFARLRMEARGNYVKIITELCTKYFITGDRLNVSGVILAGSADFKDVLAGSDFMDPRIKEGIIKQVDIGYGMEQGLSQAIEQAGDILKDVRLFKEVKIINEFLDHISRDTRKYCFGIIDTLRCLEMGSVEHLVVWEDFPWDRVQCRNSEGTEYYKLVNTVTGAINLVDNDESIRQGEEEIEAELFVEWLAQNIEKFGAEIHLVTENSNEGTQFCSGFGGLGGILRWQMDLNELGKYMDIGKENNDLDDLEDFM
ncbi:Eukaryotic peptide chain release factor subunit 1 [Spironucleus salmonicida]|uniref:Eukaryotic peptide chain release factor subunit 1 n=1 Tax=Spironucleus salmonicida TaxID=348837 RepID=V6LP21_9EUKA|nr:Eukaryotic peptide chain release factor subunit 1 [Spironucleus salmonicida]|eukprot:EST45466.1 Eukaryotic peptide chain release factor subunit 1 [Spironucleus salmonicida]